MMSDQSLLAGILNQNPSLSWRGWWSRYDELTQPIGALAQFRQETLADHDRNGLAQFGRAMAFLEVAPKTRAITREHGTYGWKHVAERWHRKTVDAYSDYYIGEGAFIAACIAQGMTIHRGKYATFTNLSARAWMLGERGRA